MLERIWSRRTTDVGASEDAATLDAHELTAMRQRIEQIVAGLEQQAARANRAGIGG